jgi:hypothetical protein
LREAVQQQAQEQPREDALHEAVAQRLLVEHARLGEADREDLRTVGLHAQQHVVALARLQLQQEGRHRAAMEDRRPLARALRSGVRMALDAAAAHEVHVDAVEQAEVDLERPRAVGAGRRLHGHAHPHDALFHAQRGVGGARGLEAPGRGDELGDVEAAVGVAHQRDGGPRFDAGHGVVQHERRRRGMGRIQQE